MKSLPARCVCLLALASASCKRDTPPPPPPDALLHVPADVHAVAWGEALAGASSTAAALVARLDGNRPGSARAQLAEQLGLDVTTTEGLAAAGLKPEGPWALAATGNDALAAWLPVKDAKLFTATLDHVGKDLQGANRTETWDAPGVRATQYARPFGTRQVPVFCAAVMEDRAVLTTGKECRAGLDRVLQLKDAESLSRAAVATEARARAGDAPVRFLVQTEFAARLGAQASNAGKLVKWAAGGIKASATGVSLGARLVLSPERRAAVLASLFPPGGAVPLLAWADADALALARGSLAWTAATSVADGVDPGALDQVRRQAGRAGLDLEEGVLALTDGNFSGALYTLDAAEWADVLKGRFDARHEAMRVAPFVAAMRAGNGAATAALVARIRERVKARGMTLAAHPADAAVEVATLPGGPAWKRWFLATEKGVVLVGGGSDARFLRALNRLRGKEPAAALDVVTTDGTSVLVLRTREAARVLDGVLARDLGTDAEALSVQSVLRKVRAQLGGLAGVRVTLGPDGDGLRVDAQLEWAPR